MSGEDTVPRGLSGSTDQGNRSGQSGKFDRVFVKKDANGTITEWAVVECKGGTSEIGGRTRKAVTPNTNNEQGTKEYIQSIIEDLSRPNSGISLTQKDLLDKLLLDILDNKVKSHILRQPFDDVTGNLKEAKLATIF